MLCLRQCGQRLLVDEMDFCPKSHVVLGAGRITRTCMFYNNEEAGRAVGHCFLKMLNFLHDSSIGGKLPSYTIWSCICIDTHNVQGVGFWFIERAWTGIQ